MTVIVAHKISFRMRGVLKRWFVEIKPSVFVGTMKNHLVEKIQVYLMDYLDKDSSLLVITSHNNCQGFKIYNLGNNDVERKEIYLSGLYLMSNKK